MAPCLRGLLEYVTPGARRTCIFLSRSAVVHWASIRSDLEYTHSTHLTADRLAGNLALSWIPDIVLSSLCFRNLSIEVAVMGLLILRETFGV